MTHQRRVRKGQRIGKSLTAGLVNDLIDVRDHFKRTRSLDEVDQRTRDPHRLIVDVKNVSGADASRFDVMAITDIVFSPDDNLDEFYNNFAFKVDVPDEETLHNCVILQAPIADGAFGKALLIGVTPARLMINDLKHQFARPLAGSSFLLETAIWGPAKILWREEIVDIGQGVVMWGPGQHGIGVRFQLKSDLAPTESTQMIDREHVLETFGGNPVVIGETEGSSEDGTSVFELDNEMGFSGEAGAIGFAMLRSRLEGYIIQLQC